MKPESSIINSSASDRKIYLSFPCSAMAMGATSHLRSISLPTRSHPLALELQEDLQVLRAHLVDLEYPTTTTLSHAGISSMQLRSLVSDLGDLFKRLTEELLLLPGSQQTLCHPSRRHLVELELDASMGLLEVVGAVRDRLGSIIDMDREIQMALRRRPQQERDHHHHLQYYSSSHEKKKAQKDIQRCLRSLKRLEGRRHEAVVVEAELQIVSEARAVASLLVRSILFSLLFMTASTDGGNKWRSLVSKVLVNKKKLACAPLMEDGDVNKLGVDIMEGMESGVECLYRRLIECRVALLNILSI